MTDEPKALVVPPMPDQDWEQDTPDFIEDLRVWGFQGWESAQELARHADELQARIAELKATLANRGSVYVTDGHGALWGTAESITWVTDELDRLESTLAQRDREVLALRAALERVVSRFAPVKHEFIFSKRNALEKAESALTSTAQAADEAERRIREDELERAITRLTGDRLRVQINSFAGWVTIASEGILREELRAILGPESGEDKP